MAFNKLHGLGQAAIAAEMVSFSTGKPYTPQHPGDYKVSLFSQAVDGDPRELRHRQIYGRADEISRKQGVSVASVMSRDGVSEDNLTAADSSLTRLNTDYAGLQNQPTPGLNGPAFKPSV